MPFFEDKKDENSHLYPCIECGLYKKVDSPKMKPAGEGRLKVLLIGESPETEDDRSGNHFSGKAGRYLRNELNQIGIDLDRDCWSMYAANCYTGEAEPNSTTIQCCRKKWVEAVQRLKPEKIILLGKSAIDSFLGHRMNEIGKIERWTGWKIPDQKYNAWVYPNYDPNSIRTRPDNRVLQDRFYQVLQSAFNHNETFPKDKTKVKIITDLNESLDYLQKLVETRPEFISFDYETSGIKPHRKGHFIKCVAFSMDGINATALLYHEDWRYRDLLRLVLKDEQILKTAHNIKFEQTWSDVIVGVKVNGWFWDSMLATHCLDNRGNISSLKFQTYVNFGVLGYENEITPYIKGIKKGEDEKNANHFNRIDEAPIKKVLEYCGLDAIYGTRLTTKQEKEMPQRLLNPGNGYDLFLDGVLAFADIEKDGWRVDINYYEKIQNHLNRVSKRAIKDIYDNEENKKWRKLKGSDISITSTDQLRELFFEVLEFKPKKFTKNKNKKTASVDEEVVTDLADKSFIASKLTESRKNKGLQDRIVAYQRESVGGIVHPSYNLHIPRSYRSSCSDPNQQNNPKRDPVSKKLIRTGVKPREKRILVAKDYSGVEVSTGCFYHFDPVMIDYVQHGAGQMHTDQAIRLFLIDSDVFETALDNKEKWAKAIRHIAKNMFVFPEFYGDYYVRCAQSMWKEALHLKTGDGITLVEHLHDEGILNYKDFEQHVKEEEEYFWDKKFTVYADWKETYWEKYQSKGYVEMLTGFRCTDVLTKNEAINRPIQGTAFHLLLWSLIETHKELKQGDWNSFIIGQIHDDLLADVDPDEFEAYNALTDEIETERIKKHWNWINVPLLVETEVSEVDGNWNDMEEI